MPVLTICSLKGGTGKSTIALNLASALSTSERQALVIDVDPQGTVAEWQKISKQEEPTIMVHAIADLHEQIHKAGPAFGLFIIIDTPPASAEAIRSAIMAADRLILPVTPGMADVWSTEKLLEMYHEAKRYKPALEARLLINRVDYRTKLGQTFRAFLVDRFGLDMADNLDLDIFKTEITSRAAFSKAYILGLTIDNYEPTGKGATEFKRLAKEVLSWQGN